MRMWRTVAVRACVWGLVCACSMAAQTSENASSPTLHVYTNLVQIQRLFLGMVASRLPGLTSEGFLSVLTEDVSFGRRMQDLRVMI
jgi:hypothetical protein